jgi:hypothetical protein
VTTGFAGNLASSDCVVLTTGGARDVLTNNNDDNNAATTMPHVTTTPMPLPLSASALMSPILNAVTRRVVRGDDGGDGGGRDALLPALADDDDAVETAAPLAQSMPVWESAFAFAPSLARTELHLHRDYALGTDGGRIVGFSEVSF